MLLAAQIAIVFHRALEQLVSPIVPVCHARATQLIAFRQEVENRDSDRARPSSPFLKSSLTAKNEYGELPPLFTLVDHQFTVGFTLQAVQSGKPGLVSAAQ
jgi:hypothetical protein